MESAVLYITPCAGRQFRCENKPMSQFSEITFVASVHDPLALPPDTGREVAFAGRSNAGKSSAINAITRRKRLAFTSKTPGRTQTINFFDCGRQRRLVDLPGYGYASVPAREQAHWELLISTYLQNRNSLIGLIIVMDSRHPLMPLDQYLMDWFAPTGKPMHVLLTKADKLTRAAANDTLRSVRASLAQTYPQSSAQLFSSPAHTGVVDAGKLLLRWLMPDTYK